MTTGSVIRARRKRRSAERAAAAAINARGIGEVERAELRVDARRSGVCGPLQALEARGAIDETQRRAGICYLSDWLACSPMRIVELDRDRVDCGGSAEARYDAAVAYERATTALGPLAPLAQAVVLLGHSCSYCALKLGTRVEAVTEMLRVALDALAVHYRFAARGRLASVAGAFGSEVQ